MVYLIKFFIMRKFNYNIEIRPISSEDASSLKTCSVSVISPLLVDSLLCLDESPSLILRDISYISQNLGKFQNISDVQQMSIVERLRSAVPASESFSDDELFSHMKSRYAQLPAEVDSYLNYINSNLDLIKADFEKLSSKEVVEPSVEPSVSSE